MKNEKVLVILYRDRFVSYSINQVLAAIDNVRDVEVVVVDNERSLMSALTSSAIDSYRIKVLGFSLLTTRVVNEDFRNFVNDALKLAYSRGFITVAGGPHATGDPLDTLGLGFKFVFVGEGEDSFREFLSVLRDGGDIYKVRGLYTLFNGEPLYTGCRSRVILDSYPPFPYWRGLFNPIEITRGCPFGCWFCQVTYMHGCVQRHRSIDKILEYCNLMVSRGIRDLRFITPNAFSYGSSRDKLMDLLEKLYLNIVSKREARVFYGSFPSEVRPDYVDEDIVRFMKNVVSNEKIIVGAQSGSNRVLNYIRRGHDIEEVYNAVETIVKHGFTPSVDFIVGFPFESEHDFRETILVMKRIVKMGGEIHMHYFIPLPGTPLAYRKPREIPLWFRKEVSRLIGAGKGYGNWLNQERISNMVFQYGFERSRRISSLLQHVSEKERCLM
ncbi:MAG: TIGR04013 family B12-binding domain/radical SAM domain-containing protein [Desulfurococcaceae archaeon]